MVFPMRHSAIMFLALSFLLPALRTEAAGFPDQVGSGYFRSQDTLPGRYRLFLQEQDKAKGIWGLGPGHGKITRSSFKADAHEGVADYTPRSLCVDCHTNHARDLHMVRMKIKCVQCHRGKPIGGIHHYYSSINTIRRHAYVCAKCHEGATPSFAAYVIHEPHPLSLDTKEAFPLLFYSVWVMVILAGGVFAFFIPYTALWWLREWLDKIKKVVRHE
jgi:hypothetical protein